MNEKDLHNFNSEFERGVRNVRSIIPSPSSFRSLMPDISRFDQDFSHLGLPIGETFADTKTSPRKSSDIDYNTRPQSAVSDTDRRVSSRR
jgi:hypothetical protein